MTNGVVRDQLVLRGERRSCHQESHDQKHNKNADLFSTFWLYYITCWSCCILTEIVVLVCFIIPLKCATFFLGAIFNNYRAKKTQAKNKKQRNHPPKATKKAPKSSYRINLLPVVPTPVSSYLAWCPYLCLWWRFGVVLGTDSLKFQQKNILLMEETLHQLI